jgi:hypothetical protein
VVLQLEVLALQEQGPLELAQPGLALVVAWGSVSVSHWLPVPLAPPLWLEAPRPRNPQGC